MLDKTKQERGGLAAINRQSGIQSVNTNLDQRLPVGEDYDEWYAARDQGSSSESHRAYRGNPTDALDRALASTGGWDSSESAYGFQPPVIIRDFGMIFNMDGSPASRIDVCEKLIACAVTRDLSGQPPGNYYVGLTSASYMATGRFIKPQTALRLALAADAWGAVKEMNPDAGRIATARLIHENYCAELALDDEMRQRSLAEWLDEGETRLILHSSFIRDAARTLSKEGYIGDLDMFSLLREEMTYWVESIPDIFDDYDCVPYSLTEGN